MHRLFSTHQAPLSMEFSRQEYWLEWVAIPFSRESSWSRDGTQVSCIADRFFTIWATRRAPQTGVPSIGRWILNLWTTREVPHFRIFKNKERDGSHTCLHSQNIDWAPTVCKALSWAWRKHHWPDTVPDFWSSEPALGDPDPETTSPRVAGVENETHIPSSAALHHSQLVNQSVRPYRACLGVLSPVWPFAWGRIWFCSRKRGVVVGSSVCSFICFGFLNSISLTNKNKDSVFAQTVAGPLWDVIITLSRIRITVSLLMA